MKNRKTNLIKIGKGAILFTSLALPLSIVSKKADASPFNKKFTPFTISTHGQIKNLLRNPYSGGETDTPQLRYFNYLSGMGNNRTEQRYSTTITAKHSSTTPTGQAKFILGNVEPTPLKFRSSLSVRLQAKPQNAIITQQGTSSQGSSNTSVSQTSQQQSRRTTSRSSQQSRSGSTGSSNSSNGFRRLSSSSNYQTGDTESSEHPQPTNSITTSILGKITSDNSTPSSITIKMENGENITLPLGGEKVVLHDNTKTNKSPTKPLVPVSASLKSTEFKSESAEIQIESAKKEFAKIINQSTSESSSESITSGRQQSNENTTPLEGKFVTTAEGEILLFVKSKSMQSETKPSNNKTQTSKVNSTTPTTPKNIPSPKVKLLTRFYDELSNTVDYSNKQRNLPIGGANVKGLRQRFENQNNQNSGKVNSNKDFKPTGQVSQTINLFERESRGSRVILPNNNSDSSNNNNNNNSSNNKPSTSNGDQGQNPLPSSGKINDLKNHFEELSNKSTTPQKQQFTPSKSNVAALRKFFENQNNKDTGRDPIVNFRPTGQVSSAVNLFEKLNNNSVTSNNTTSTSSSSSSNITHTSSTSSPITTNTTNKITTTPVAQATKNNNSPSDQTQLTSPSKNTNFMGNNPNDGNQRKNEEIRQNNTNPYKLTIIKLNLDVVDTGDIDRIEIKTKIKIG